MAQTTIKEEARLFVERLPEDATWEDLQYEIYFRQAVEAGLNDSREGRTVPPREARRRLGLAAGLNVRWTESALRGQHPVVAIGPERARPLSTDDPTPPDSFTSAIDPAVSRLIFLMMAGLLAGGFVAFRLLSHAPAPAEVAADPVLSQGRTIFLGRCATCHGAEGRGDGPIAANLIGPPVGNLTDQDWKHGDRPEQVTAVIAKGVPGTRMEGWSHVLDPPDVRARRGLRLLPGGSGRSILDTLPGNPAAIRN